MKRDIDKVVIKELTAFLKNYEFTYDKNRNAFVRYFDGGFNQVGYSIVDYSPKFQLSFYFLIRIDAIENIIQKFIFVLEQYRNQTWTLNTNIDHFTQKKEYDILSLEKLDAVLRDITLTYSTEIDSFLRNYSNIDELDKALNFEYKNIGHMNDISDFLRPIVIAKINGNKNFNKVSSFYLDKYVKEYFLDKDDGPNKIKEVIEYLNNN